MRNIRLFKPCVGEDELKAVEGCMERSWLGLGPKVAEFEQAFLEYLGEPGGTVALNSATAALHLSLSSLNLAPGDEVLVPNITFISSALAVSYCSLQPVFVDVDESLTISVEDMKRKITEKTKAVVIVHLGGQPCDIPSILDIAKQYDLKVIEDCANCTGGSFQGQKLGTFGDFGCYSFEEKKNMTTGDGGLIFSRHQPLIDSIKKVRWCGIDRDTWRRLKQQDEDIDDPYHWYYEVSNVGYKYNMNDLAASIGLVQLKKLDWMNRQREILIDRYVNGLKGLSAIKPAFPYELNSSGYWLFAVRTEPRNELITHLKKCGVSTGVHFMPMTQHPLYETVAHETPYADRVWKELITLPLYPELADSDVDYVVAAIREFFEVNAVT